MRYTNDFKEKVVKYYNVNKKTKTIPDVAEKFDVKYNTLYRWVQGDRVKNDETLEKDIKRAKKYKKEKLSSIDVLIDENIFESFKRKCNQEDVSQAEILRKYIESCIGKKESDFE